MIRKTVSLTTRCSSVYQRLLASSALIAAALIPAAAHAAGTLADTDITLNVSVNFKVDGVDQSKNATPAKVKVDRVINMTLVEAGVDDLRINVAPGTVRARASYKLTNSSNAAVSFRIEGTVLTNSTYTYTKDGKTINHQFDVTSPGVMFDTNKNGAFELGTDPSFALNQQVYFTLAPDTDITFWMFFNIPTNVKHNQTSLIIPLARAVSPSIAPTPGTLEGNSTTDIAATQGPDTDGVDTVLGELASPLSQAYDGMITAVSPVSVQAADLRKMQSLNPAVFEIENTNPGELLVPGAEINYCAGFYNSPSAAELKNFVLKFAMPSNISFDVNTPPRIGTYNIPEAEYSENKCTAATNMSTGSLIEEQDVGWVATGTIPTLSPGYAAVLLVKGKIK